jgi:hypothetical protein
MRSWLIRSIVVLGSIVVSLGFSEIALRVTGLAQIPREMHSPFPRSYYVLDNTSGFDIGERFPETEFSLMDYAQPPLIETHAARRATAQYRDAASRGVRGGGPPRSETCALTRAAF